MLSPTDAAVKPKIVVLISGSGSNLQSLIDHIESNQIDAQISLVISNKADVLGLARAKQANIATQVIPHNDFQNQALYEAELIRAIEDVQPNLIALAGFMRILSAEFIFRFTGKILNIHPSLLPKYKGLDTHQRVLDAGEKQHGASVHFVTEDLDGGPIILQASVTVNKNDSVPELASRVLQQEHIIYPIAIKWFCEGRLRLSFKESTLEKSGLKNSETKTLNSQTMVTLDNKVIPAEGILLPS